MHETMQQLAAHYGISTTMLSNLYTMSIAAGQDPRQAIPPGECMPTHEARLLRARLIMEEALETVRALGFTVGVENEWLNADRHLDFYDIGEPDMEGIIDGVCDTIYVCVGTLAAMGIPDLPHLDAVCAANDAKFPGGHAMVDEHGKYVKPYSWTPPDHTAVRDITAIVGPRVCDLIGMIHLLKQQ